MKYRSTSTIFTMLLITVLYFSCKAKTDELTTVVNMANKGRTELLFDAGWRFHRDDTTGAESVKFDDSSWRKVDLPHDWSIENLPGTNSPFDTDAISMVNGGFTTGGTGWYRKSFVVHGALKERKVLVQFDGIYMNPEIWINGVSLGSHPYGYTSFWFDITDKLNPGKANILAVKVRNEGVNSRWYSGSGIYRHVWIKTVDPVHIDQWGTGITTTVLSLDAATVNIKTDVVNQSTSDLTVRVLTYILNKKGDQVGKNESEQIIENGGTVKYSHNVTVNKPDFWSTDTPDLYNAITEVYVKDELTDSTKTTFGIRSVKFDIDGFMLNGKELKLKGGCFHHDNGPLGSKSFDRAEERRIELLKASGFNAIRCSHNPPSPAMLEACDRIGMLVIDEAFDMWADQKNPGDYHLWFNDWWMRDIESMVLRDRNHPSVIMWSIGNEIPERQKPEVITLAKTLGDYVRKIDPSRPVTAAVNNLSPIQDPYFSTLDVAGYNYAAGGDHLRANLYESDHKRMPERVMFGSESYALEAFSAWMSVLDYPYVTGDFVWTAWDYIGEASIGWRGYPQEKDFFPWNLAYCGDIDICGWKRPQSYYRDALWMKDQLSVFVTPPKPSFEPNPKRETWSKWHWDDVVADWNWIGYENTPLKVSVYSSCDEVEMFLNDKSLGRRKTDRSTEFRAYWTVPYQPGELVAIGYSGGKKVNSAALVTAGKPTKVKLSADRKEIRSDGQDLSYITVELTDSKGIRDPKAVDLVKFEIEGPGKIIGVGNANPVSTESFVNPERKAWQGRCMVIIRSENTPGVITIKAVSGSLPPAILEVKSSGIK